MGLIYKLPEGGGNPSQFPKDMLYPCPTGRNNRTGALASRGDPKARVWRPVQEVGTDYCTHTSQRKTVTTHIPFGWHYTAWPLQQTEISPRPTSTIRKIPGGREARQFGGTPTDASCSGRQPLWWTIPAWKRERATNDTSGNIWKLHFGTSPLPPSN